jgi:hypothetical protein
MYILLFEEGRQSVRPTLMQVNTQGEAEKVNMFLRIASWERTKRQFSEEGTYRGGEKRLRSLRTSAPVR